MTVQYEMAKPALRTRRRLLATVGGALGTLFAGCVGDSTGPEETGGDSDDGNDSGEGVDGAPNSSPPEGEGDLPLSAPPGETPGSCPGYNHVAEVVCFENIDTDDVDTYLEPSGQSVTPEEAFTFTLRNGSDRILETNFYNWAVHRYVDGEWYRVGPQEWPEPLMHLAPGDTHTWSVTVRNEGALAGESVDGASGTDELSLQALGGGYYAFRARGWFEDETHEAATAFATTVELDADPISLVRTRAIETVTWEGDTLVAETSRGDPEKHTRAAYKLERVDGEADRRLITEQVYRDDRLRDALALAHEYETDSVRLEEHTGSTPIFARSPEGRFTFQGSTYEVRTEKLDEATA
jgi:hypothetical protein